MNNVIIDRLFELKDFGYRDFMALLIPNISKDTIIGIRTPELKKFAKELAKNEEAQKFILSLPHSYYEENNLHSFLIGTINDFDRCILEVNRFLPYVDNWATCDSLRPKVFKQNHGKLIDYIGNWIASDHLYTVRFGIEMLLVHFLDDHFSPEHLEIVSSVNTTEYYLEMMVAWYFATALAKQWESTFPYIANHRLEKSIHNQTIKKSLESFRITPKQKDILKKLKA